MSRARALRNGIITRAREKQLPADLDIFTAVFICDWLQLQPTCECCGVTFDVGYKFDRQKKDNSPSLDRFEPSVGYVKGNVFLVCWRCNNLKRDATADELQTIVDWMKDKLGEKVA